MRGNKRKSWKDDGEISSTDHRSAAGQENNLYKSVETRRLWKDVSKEGKCIESLMRLNILKDL